MSLAISLVKLILPALIIGLLDPKIKRRGAIQCLQRHLFQTLGWKWHVLAKVGKDIDSIRTGFVISLCCPFSL